MMPLHADSVGNKLNHDDYGLSTKIRHWVAIITSKNS